MRYFLVVFGAMRVAIEDAEVDGIIIPASTLPLPTETPPCTTIRKPIVGITGPATLPIAFDAP